MIGRLSNVICLLLGLSGALSACVGTETGNPDYAATVSFNMRAPEPSEADAQLHDADFSVERLWLTIDGLEVVPGSSCLDAFLSGDQGLPFAGLGTGDHSTPAAAQVNLMLPDDDYCGLQVSLSPAVELGDDLPAELVGKAIQLEVTLYGRPLTVSIGRDALVRFASANGMLLPSGSRSVLVVFDPVAWLGSIDTRQYAALPEDELLIDETHNVDLHALLIANLADAFTLWRDDGTGTPPDTGFVADALPALDTP